MLFLNLDYSQTIKSENSPFSHAHAVLNPLFEKNNIYIYIYNIYIMFCYCEMIQYDQRPRDV